MHSTQRDSESRFVLNHDSLLPSHNLPAMFYLLMMTRQRVFSTFPTAERLIIQYTPTDYTLSLFFCSVYTNDFMIGKLEDCEDL